MKFIPIEDARGSKWRDENRTIDDDVCDEVGILMERRNPVRFREALDVILTVADCLVYEGRLTDKAYWNYCEVYRMVASSFRVLYPVCLWKELSRNDDSTTFQEPSERAEQCLACPGYGVQLEGANCEAYTGGK